MTPSTTRRRLLSGTGTVGLGAIAGCFLLERDEHATVTRRFDGDVDALAVDADTGPVAVRGHGDEAIRVRASKHAASEDGLDALSLAGHRDGDRLVVETDRTSGPGPLGWLKTPTMQLEVEVPPDVAVEHVATDAGGIEIGGVTGPLAATATHGDVYVGSIEGAVDARTNAGDVTVRDATGPIAARTASGDVTVDGVIETLRSDAGEIAATVRGLAEKPKIRGATGDVSLAFAAELDVTIETDVGLGDVDVHGDGLQTVAEEAADSVRIVVGEGSRRLVVETDTGEVTVTTLGASAAPTIGPRPAAARKL